MPLNLPARNLLLLAAVSLTVAVAAFGPAIAQQSGAIRGIVYDVDFEGPLGGVRVTLIGSGLSTFTGDNGNFLLEGIPPGSHTLSFSKPGYERELRTVVVSAGRLAEVRVDLASEVYEMAEMIVTGADLLASSELGLLNIRAEALTVQDSVSTEIISKAGAGDIAGALKLVVGASVSEGKYATVRGLSDRYIGTTVNGVRIPSTDPRRRAVQLDLFPTGTIDGLTVTKTFTPDLQGDFTGGGVDILTKSVPDGMLLKFSSSIAYDSLATDNPNFLTYRGGGVGGTGFRADDHALPANSSTVGLTSNPNFFPNDQQIADAEEYDRITRSFSPVIGTTTDAPGVNHGFSFVGGNRFSVGGGTLGFLGALTYSHKYKFHEDGQNNRVVNSLEGPIAVPRSDSKGTDDLLIGMTASLEWSRGDRQEYNLTLLGNEAAEDVARFQEATDIGGLSQNQTLHYTERVVGSAQVRGKHEIGEDGPLGAGPWKLDWLAATNTTRQEEPDVRFFLNVFNFNAGANAYIAQAPTGVFAEDITRRTWREIDETSDQGAVNVELPFVSWTDGEGRIKAGLFSERSDREFNVDSYYYFFESQPGGSAARENKKKAQYITEDPNDLWTDHFLDSDRIGLADNRCPVGQPATTCSAPNQLLWIIRQLEDDVEYTAEQEIDAAYAMAEVPVHPLLDVIAGVRYESTILRVVPVNPITGKVKVIVKSSGANYREEEIPQEDAITDIDDSALLPALAVVVKPTSRMNVRVSWSRTLARPQFRELAPVSTQEFLAGDAFAGNPGLRLSDITNWDARWEWFRREGEVLAASVFHKDLSDPIELISFSANGTDWIQPVNYETGFVRGIEVETRLDIGDFAGWAEGLLAGVNVTWNDSEVDVPPDEQEALAGTGYALDEPTRALQGQPDLLLNVFLTYDNDRTGTSAGLFYNRTGEKLLTGAAVGLDEPKPNLYERAFDVLDFTVSQKIRDNMKFTARAQNLLVPERGNDYRDPRGKESIKQRYETAQVISLSLGLTW
jgi:TonB-dependent receptor